MAQIATQIGASAAEAQAIFSTLEDVAVDTLPGGEPLDLSNVTECRNVFEHRYGDQARLLISDAQLAFAKLPADVRAWLDHPDELGGKLTNSPSLLFALAMYQRGVTRISPKDAASELARLRATKQYQKGERAFTDQVALLTKISAQGKSREVPIPPKAAPVAKSAIQTRIDAIRADVNYTGETKLRQALMDEMQSLYQQLHGTE